MSRVTRLQLQRLFVEALLWKRLNHPNVVPFLGVSVGYQGQIYLVSSWMKNGNILEYTKRNPEVNRLQLVILPRWCAIRKTDGGSPEVGGRGRWPRVSTPSENNAREHSGGMSSMICRANVLAKDFLSQIS